MSPRATTIAQRFAADFEDLRELERDHPAEVEAIVCSLVAHLRSWRPESVSPLGVLPPPGEVIRDPRGESQGYVVRPADTDDREGRRAAVMTARRSVLTAALARLRRSCELVSKILDDGDRDPTWIETQELEAAALDYGRALRDRSRGRGRGCGCIQR